MNKFKHETSVQNYEWHRRRTLDEKLKKNHYTENRIEWNLNEIEKRHGKRAARELVKEFNAKKGKKRTYFT